MRMDLRVLDYFLAVTEEQNITRAAERLHITQPTLSRQLMQLERELGARLFERTNHSVKLTAEGMMFRRRAQEILELAARAREEVVADSENLRGRISIGCWEMRSVEELSKLIADFQQAFPAVKFLLYSGNNEDIEAGMAQGNLDMGLFLEPFPAAERYATHKMKTIEEWGTLIHEAHPLAQRDCIRPGDLVGTKVVTVNLGTPVHKMLGKWSGEYTPAMDFCVNYNVLSNGVVAAEVRQGVVICLKPLAQYEHMHYVPFQPRLQFGSLLAWRSEETQSRALKKFIAFLREKEEKGHEKDSAK